MKSENQNFIHLKVRSSYSLLEGAINPKDIVKLAIKQSQPAVGITDSNNMFGSLEFSGACTSEGVQPIIGCTLKVNFSEKQTQFNDVFYDDLTLIAKDEQGYLNLLELVSKSYLDKDPQEKAHVKLKDLRRLNHGIIALTGGNEGVVNRHIINGQNAKAKEFLETLYQIYNDRLYVELIRTGFYKQSQIEEVLLPLAYDMNIPLVATNDVYFADMSVHKAHDVLMCIADGRYIAEKDRKQVSKECHFKSSREMIELFKDLPEAIENTVNIAKRCAVMSEFHDPMLPSFDCGKGRSESEELRAQAIEGLKIRLETQVYKNSHSDQERKEIYDKYFTRLEFELEIITNMKFPGYFLIVSDFIKWSKANNIPVGPGRGSGAGSVVAWVLQITDLDPLHFGLLFERFLNPERVSMPDFDIDFCQERRQEVIAYVQQKYGRDKVAQIITFGKLQAKAVVRDVGRVLQMPYGQIDRISKLIPFNPIDPVTLQKAIDMDKAFKQMIDEDKDVKNLINISLKLEGLNRHCSTHAAGVVIADRPLQQLVPVYSDPRSDMPVCGYSMKYAEGAGLVKFDFLGLKTLTVIAKTCDFIRQKGIDIDIAKIPIDDRKSFEMISKGDSIGVFQIESAGMRDTLRKMKPDNIEDIIALISLYRPGPMDNIPAYIRRKHGEEEPDYLHPMLEGILKETYGVIIYQEQVMQIAQVMGGYSLGAADLLRRAMGKKIASEMDKQRKTFVDGAVQNGVSKEKASSIFDLVAKFAGYGFNKSHAAAYAMISYQTAYLKAHYQPEFLCASMNLEINDTDKLNTFRQEAVAQSIKVLPPEINYSSAYFKPEKLDDGTLGIRYGLGALKNVGTAAMQAVEQEREQGGKFKDIFDFASRLEGQVMNKRQIESLIKAGAFDELHKNRKQIYDAIEDLLKYNSLVSSEKTSNQTSLFGDAGTNEIDKPKLQYVDDWSEIDRMNNEFSAIGLYLNQHPVNLYKDLLNKLKTVSYSDLCTDLSTKAGNIKVAAVVISKRMRSSARGRFATITFSDPTGIFEISVFDDDLLSEANDLLSPGNCLFVECEVKKDDGGIRLTAKKIDDINEITVNYNLKITLNSSKNIQKIKDIFGDAKPNKSTVTFYITHADHVLEIKTPDNFVINSSDVDKLGKLPEVESVDCL